MERVGVDILGPFPTTDQGNRYVLVAMDYFTKWPEAYAVPDQSAVTTAERLVNEMFCRFGVPEELHSDQGRNFEAAVFKEVCQRLGIRKTQMTPLHPQSDGLVERFNHTLATQLAILTSRQQRDWDQHLPLVLMAYRSAVQESTKCTPAALMFGHELRTPVDLVFGSPPRAGSVRGPRVGTPAADRPVVANWSSNRVEAIAGRSIRLTQCQDPGLPTSPHHPLKMRSPFFPTMSPVPTLTSTMRS